MSNENKGQGPDPKKSADDLKKQILGSIQGPYTGEQTSRWILNMNDEALVKQISAASESNSLLDVNVVKLIDVIFDDFQRYVFEYQRTPAGSRFILNCQRPTANDLPAAVQYGQAPILCQGHISTANWVMIVQGRVGKVSAYIVPVEFLVGFKAAQNDFTPFMEAKAFAARGKTDWRIDEHSISKEMLPIISKRIFGALIKVETGQAQETDKFFFDPSEPPDEEDEYIDSGEEKDAPQLLSDSTGPSQQRSIAQQQQYQQPQFGQNPQGGSQQIPAYEQQRPLAAPQALHTSAAPPVFLPQGASQQTPAYQQQQGSQQMPAYQQQQGSQQMPAYQQQQGSQQMPAYQQQQGASQQAPAYQQQPPQQQPPPRQPPPPPQDPPRQMPPYQQQQGSQQMPAYQQQQGAAAPMPVYQQQQAAAAPMPGYQQPQGNGQQPPVYQQPQTAPPTPAYQQQAGQQIPQIQAVSPQNPQQQQRPQQNPAYQSPPDGSMNQIFDRNKLVVGVSLDELVAKLDVELESLARIGMKAIQSQDMAAAQFTINRATRLKDVRQRVNDLSNEWKSSVS